MRIYVCVKQVPDTRGRVALKKDGSLDRSKMPAIINPDDLSAVEAALRLRERTGATVTAITMGPPSAAVMLHELYAMGVDETVLVTARELVGSDTFGTSTVLASVISHLGLSQDDIILCGRQAIDGDTAQVGPELAEKLAIAQLTYVSSIEPDGDGLLCRRRLEDGYMSVRLHTPCLLSCMAELAQPRYMSIKRIFDWNESANLRVINYGALKALPLFDGSVMGIENSPTLVLTSFAMPKKSGALMLEGSAEDMAATAFGLMHDKHVLG